MSTTPATTARPSPSPPARRSRSRRSAPAGAAVEHAWTEAQLQAAIIELAQLSGWLVFHCRDSRTSIGPGLPDLVMCHETTGRVLFAELKSSKGRLRPEQTRWLYALAQGHGVDVRVWTPADWPENVQRVLLLAPPGRNVTTQRVQPR